MQLHETTLNQNPKMLGGWKLTSWRMNSKRGLLSHCCTLRLLPLKQLSTHTTSFLSSSISLSIKCDPMKPHPPVTKILQVALTMDPALYVNFELVTGPSLLCICVNVSVVQCCVFGKIYCLLKKTNAEGGEGYLCFGD